MADALKVYWIPGCSSCLKAKEFLRQHGVRYVSINAAESPDAAAELDALGARALPVIARGSEFVLGQDLDEIGRFVGVSHDGARLSPADYIDKLCRLLAAASRYTLQLSDEQLSANFPGRDRSFHDLAFHIPMVVQGFLDAARGGQLAMEIFERTPVVRERHAIAGVALDVRRALADWWEASGRTVPATVRTYYGARSGLSVLDRTAWHAAQHCRQLEAVVASYGIEPNGPLGDAELAGLPLPEHVFDDEIATSFDE